MISPYFTGKIVSAKCEDLIYGLVLGDPPGVCHEVPLRMSQLQ